MPPVVGEKLHMPRRRGKMQNNMQGLYRVHKIVRHCQGRDLADAQIFAKPFGASTFAALAARHAQGMCPGGLFADFLTGVLLAISCVF